MEGGGGRLILKINNKREHLVKSKRYIFSMKILSKYFEKLVFNLNVFIKRINIQKSQLLVKNTYVQNIIIDSQ